MSLPLTEQLRRHADYEEKNDTAIMCRNLLRDAADEIECLRNAGRAVIEADARGQGQPFAEAMDRLYALVGHADD